jgi:hypothetical protein
VPVPAPELPEVITAHDSLVDAVQAQPLGATTLKLSLEPNSDAKALPGLTVRAEHAAVASEIFVTKEAPYVPADKAREVAGKPALLLVEPVTNASPAPSVAMAQA